MPIGTPDEILKNIASGKYRASVDNLEYPEGLDLSYAVIIEAPQGIDGDTFCLFNDSDELRTFRQSLWQYKASFPEPGIGAIFNMSNRGFEGLNSSSYSKVHIVGKNVPRHYSSVLSILT